MYQGFVQYNWSVVSICYLVGVYVFSEMGKGLASFYICQLSGSRCSTGSLSLFRESEPVQGVRACSGSQSLLRELEPAQGLWAGAKQHR